MAGVGAQPPWVQPCVETFPAHSETCLCLSPVGVLLQPIQASSLHPGPGTGPWASRRRWRVEQLPLGATRRSLLRHLSSPHAFSSNAPAQVRIGEDEPPPSWDPVSGPWEFVPEPSKRSGESERSEGRERKQQHTSRLSGAQYNEVDSENEVGAIIPDLRSEGEEGDASLQPTEEEEAASVESTNVQRSVDVASRNRDENEPKRQRKSGNIEGLLERYLDMRTKQAEDEAAQLAKEKEISQGSDFSIKRCISVLNTLEVTKVEKAKAYGVFKNPDNRQIFLSACDDDQESALIWLQDEMA